MLHCSAQTIDRGFQSSGAFAVVLVSRQPARPSSIFVTNRSLAVFAMFDKQHVCQLPPSKSGIVLADDVCTNSLTSHGDRLPALSA